MNISYYRKDYSIAFEGNDTAIWILNFEGKKFVTGAGIRRATVERCAAEGARVIITNVDSEGGEETVELIEGAEGDATFHELDVRDEVAFADLIETTVQKHGLDALVNNAGSASRWRSLRKPTPRRSIGCSTSTFGECGTAVTLLCRR